MKVKYKHIKEEIRSKILSGYITPHQKLSSESEMMKQFQASRYTVRLAIGELVSEGWLYKEQGAGTFCSDRIVFKNSTLERSNKKIAIVTTFISEYIFPSIIRGAESYLSQHGYYVNIFNTNNEYEQEERVLNTIQAHGYDGVIIEPTKSAMAHKNIGLYLKLETLNIPYIMLNAFYDVLDPVSITVNDVKGGFLQTEHLINLGHSDIVGIYKIDDKQGVQRLKGYIKAHKAYGIKINPDNIITYNTKNPYFPIKQLEKILLRDNFPSALACYNDQLALSLLDVIRNKELKIPRDLSIIGFDDSILTEASEVKLTSVSHPKSKMGEEAARLIIELIHNKKYINKKSCDSIVYEPGLIIRNSTKKSFLTVH